MLTRGLGVCVRLLYVINLFLCLILKAIKQSIDYSAISGSGRNCIIFFTFSCIYYDYYAYVCYVKIMIIIIIIFEKLFLMLFLGNTFAGIRFV